MPPVQRGQVFATPNGFAIRWYEADGTRRRASGFRNQREAEIRLAEHVERIRVERLGLPPVGTITSHVYLAWSPLWQPDLVKIGKADDIRGRWDVNERIASIKAEVLFSFRGGRPLEEELKRRFASDRVDGEYFRLTAPLIATFAQLAEEDTCRSIGLIA
jgi:hypothetical protein